MKYSERYNNKSTAYKQYRPLYPSDIYEWIDKNHMDLSGCQIADLGCGTGIFSRPLLERGAYVIGVEPNESMLAEASRFLADYDRFTPCLAAAEYTGIPNNSIDLLTVAQAFHWFDTDKALAEFRRILTQKGKLLLVWNERMTGNGGLMQHLDQILSHHFTGHIENKHRGRKIMQNIDHFFRPDTLTIFEIRHDISMCFEEVMGLIQSFSYYKDESFKKLAPEIQNAMEIYANEGRVKMEYRCVAYIGEVCLF